METTKHLDGELAWFIGLVEGEGSFNVSTPDRGHPKGQAAFGLRMSDQDVIERTANLLKSLGIDLNILTYQDGRTYKNDASRLFKRTWAIRTTRASYLKIIIDKTYDYYSDKKQSDCDRVLKNLADRGLL